jgi:hypothetical protein
MDITFKVILDRIHPKKDSTFPIRQEYLRAGTTRNTPLVLPFQRKIGTNNFNR